MNVLAELIDELREATSLHMKSQRAEKDAYRRMMATLEKVGQHQRAVGELKENILLGYINHEDPTLHGLQSVKDELFDIPVYIALVIEGEEEEEGQCRTN